MFSFTRSRSWLGIKKNGAGAALKQAGSETLVEYKVLKLLHISKTVTFTESNFQVRGTPEGGPIKLKHVHNRTIENSYK